MSDAERRALIAIGRAVFATEALRRIREGEASEASDYVSNALDLVRRTHDDLASAMLDLERASGSARPAAPKGQRDEHA